jgi:hypothetical protein
VVARFSSKTGSLAVELTEATFFVNTSVVAGGDGPLGRGVHGAIPLHLVFEARGVMLSPARPMKTKLTLVINKGDFDGAGN